MKALSRSIATAARWLYSRAPELGPNPALEVDKPHRSRGRRHALADFELIELYQVTCTGGDDPLLDQLIFDTGMELGTRRDGACRLTVGQGIYVRGKPV